MYHNSQEIILASSSPRRQQYLHDMGLRFSVRSVAILEKHRNGEDPASFVERMAQEKAVAIRKHFPGSWIVSGDTVVCLGSKILGKPTDAEDAVKLLMLLSGKAHLVRTGFCVTQGLENIEIVRSVTTKVRFAPFSESTARAYVATGESLDKAGAYAIQGVGACLVQSIEGSYSNVVGFPLFEILRVLEELGVVTPSWQHCGQEGRAC